MEMIIKTTSLCNFDCSFCSAAGLDIPLHEHLPSVLKDEILQKRPTNIIITGGEPLLTPRPYMEELLALGDFFDFGMTSNLMVWYNNPEQYDWIVKHPRNGIATSFQYGGERKMADGTPYTEDLFRKVYAKFKETTNKKLPFLYVLTGSSAPYAEKACLLAKELGTLVRLNNCLPVGGATEYFPRYKHLRLLLDIRKLGLDKYELTWQEAKRNVCSFSRSPSDCTHIQTCWVDSRGVLVRGNCEELTCLGVTTDGKPLGLSAPILFEKCRACRLMRLCNGCASNARFTRPIKEQHCEAMKQMEKELIDAELA